MSRPFLTARWRHLVMLNYTVDPGLLVPMLPAGTRLDQSEGAHWLSVVAFLFEDTRLGGVAVPFHVDFEELNLRFYVRREVPDEARGVDHRRGVVFVKELVPSPAIAVVARLAYNENYVARPMRHTLQIAAGPEGPLAAGDRVSYGFRSELLGGEWGEVAATVSGPAASLEPGSHPEFIAEHYWGYAAQRDGGTVEYQVEHPPWEVHPVSETVVRGDLEGLYGAELAAVLRRHPETAFLAVGSEVSVQPGGRIDTGA